MGAYAGVLIRESAAAPPAAERGLRPPPARAERLSKRQMATDLRLALARDELEIEYQPIVDSLAGAVTAFEALLRWNHPLGRVSPADFIPLAEKAALMPELGAWVVARACRDCAGWPGGLTVSVNMSASQFADPAVERVVASTLASAALPAERLQLELTETFLLSDPAALLTLSRMRAAGVSVALDDFGTGYSSLSYLHKFPFDKLKIDGCFTKQTEQCRHSHRMLEALMRFAAVLEIPVVVEGVETAQQLQTIRSIGACEIQGFLFGRPMAAAKVAAFLAERLS